MKLGFHFYQPPTLFILICSLHPLQFHFQYGFDDVVKNDSIVLFGGIVTSETSTDN